MDTFENVLIPPSLSHPTSPHPGRQVGLNDFDIWAHVWRPMGSGRCHFYYIDLLSKRNSSRQNHLAQSGERGREISYFPPPDKWYRCGCYLPDGFDSSLPRERHSTFWPMRLRRACLAQPLWSGKILGELQGVQPPHPGRFRRFVISLSGLLSPKFEFVWLSDVILFQSLMCLFLM